MKYERPLPVATVGGLVREVRQELIRRGRFRDDPFPELARHGWSRDRYEAALAVVTRASGRSAD
jgi:hypothetical protein